MPPKEKNKGYRRGKREAQRTRRDLPRKAKEPLRRAWAGEDLGGEGDDSGEAFEDVAGFGGFEGGEEGGADEDVKEEDG